MQVFITTANARSLEFKLDPEKGRKLYLEDLYHLSLWMLSVQERRWLAAACMLYQNPEFFIQNFYTQIEQESELNSNWVFIGGPPAYHHDASCKNLLRDYKNYKIPAEIAHKGEVDKKRFREWFNENKHLIDYPSKFVDKMTARFLLKNPPRIEEYTANNSGVVIEQNPSLDEIKNKIDKSLASMDIERARNPILINKFGMQSYRVVNFDIKLENPKDLETLTSWHAAKNSLQIDLKTYFKVRFNPDLNFQKSLLQSIGFRPCGDCADIEVLF